VKREKGQKRNENRLTMLEEDARTSVVASKEIQDEGSDGHRLLWELLPLLRLVRVEGVVRSASPRATESVSILPV